MTNRHHISRGLGALVASVLAAGVITTAAAAEAPPGQQEVPLHNDTAPTYVSGEEACSFDGVDPMKSYWHFVLSPNDGTWEFKTIHLVTTDDPEGSDYSPIIPNGEQLDNVFIEVPEGVALDDLIAEGSYAWIDPDDPTPRQFNLSHNCVADRSEPDVSVSKTVVTNWERTHRWEIDKVLVSGPTAVYSGDVVTGANFTYRVDQTELSAVDAYTVSGVITVENGNDVPATVTEVTDILPGFTCDVEALPSEPVVVEGSSLELDYTCGPESELPSGDLTNTATASYTYGEDGSDSASTDAMPVVFSSTPDDEVDADPVLTDDQYPGVVAGEEYQIYVPASTEACTTGFTNTATLTGDDETVLDDDYVTVKFCLSVGGRTIGFWSNNNGKLALATGSPTIWSQVKAMYPNVTGSLSTVSQLQSFLTAKTTNCSTDCLTMLRAQFIATALNSLYITAYGTQAVMVPVDLDTVDGSANGCSTVTNLLGSIYAQYPFPTTAQRTAAKTVLDTINQDKPINPFQCTL